MSSTNGHIDCKWQSSATNLYASVQERIPQAWRLPEKMLAPAWVFAGDVDPTTIQPTDVRSIAASSGILSPRELAITESTDVLDLQAKLASREYSAYEVALGECESGMFHDKYASTHARRC
jgi:hypothetical protein